MDYDQFVAAFFELEKKLDLLNLDLNGVKLWLLVRNRVYSNIANDLNLLQSQEHTVTDNSLKRVWFMIKYFFRAFLNLFIPVKKVDVLVFNHPRKVLKHGVYQDIYSQWYVEKMHQEHKKVLVVDAPLNWSQHLITKTPYVRNIENFGIVKKLFAKFVHGTALPSSYQTISQALMEVFSTDGNLLKEMSAQYESFVVDKRYYSKLVKKSKASKVVYVVKNNMNPLISACQDLGIEVWEIQHGVMGKHNIMYSYEGYETVPYFPDGMYLMSQLWFDKTPMPLKSNQVAYYETEITLDSDRVMKTVNSVIVLSQPTVANALIEFLDTNVVNTQYDFVFKLHPSEFGVWRDVYPRLAVLAEKHNNLSVVDSYAPSLNELLKTSQYLVGVNSTSILEGIYHDVKPFILNTPGSSLMTSLLDEGTYALVSKDEVVDFEKVSQPFIRIDRDQLFYKQDASV